MRQIQSETCRTGFVSILTLSLLTPLVAFGHDPAAPGPELRPLSAEAAPAHVWRRHPRGSCAAVQPGDIEEPPSENCGGGTLFNPCDTDPPAYSQISCGNSVHGRSGTYAIEGLQYRDVDFWQFTVTEPGTVIIWTVVADFGVLTGIESLDCPRINIVDAGTAFACSEESIISDCLPPGDYAVFVTPSAFTGIPCDSQYRGTLTCSGCPGACAGDLDNDGQRGLQDLAILLGHFGTTGPSLSGDLDSDGDVDIQDLAELLSVFGVAC